MNSDKLREVLLALNNELALNNVTADIAIYGGTVMCLALGARKGTYDIDDIFEPKATVLNLAKRVGDNLGLPNGWLNDGVKGFLSQNNNVVLFDTLSNLRIFMASPDYMFAMKCLSCRLDNKNEVEDIRFLIKYLGITSVALAEAVIYKYYPLSRILPKTFYFLMEELEVWFTKQYMK